MQTTGVCFTGRARALRRTSLFLRSSLLPRFDALRTEVEAFFRPILDDTHPLYVGVPAAPGVPHGMAHVIAKLRPLAATLAPGHLNTPCMTDVVKKRVTGPLRLGHELRDSTTNVPFTQTYRAPFMSTTGSSKG